MVEKLFKRKEAALMLGISVDTLDDARADGRITYIQYVENGAVFFTESSLKEYMARCTCRAIPQEKRRAVYRKPGTPLRR